RRGRILGVTRPRASRPASPAAAVIANSPTGTHTGNTMASTGGSGGREGGGAGFSGGGVASPGMDYQDGEPPRQNAIAGARAWLRGRERARYCLNGTKRRDKP